MGSRVKRIGAASIMNRVACCFLLLSLFGLMPTPEGAENSIVCSICELVINGIDSAIVDPTNEQEIRDWLLKACGYLDSQIETICLEFVYEYTDDIIEQVVAGYLDPQTVCTAISACP